MVEEDLRSQSRSAYKAAIAQLAWALDRLVTTDSEIDRHRVVRLWERMRETQRHYDELL